MGKIVKKRKVKAKRKNLTPDFQQARETALDQFLPKPRPEGEELDYRKGLQEQLLAVCREVIDEQRTEILRRAQERILALRMLNKHK